MAPVAVEVAVFVDVVVLVLVTVAVLVLPSPAQVPVVQVVVDALDPVGSRRGADGLRLFARHQNPDPRELLPAGMKPLELELDVGGGNDILNIG